MGPLLLGECGQVLREGTSHTLEWGSSPVRLWTPTLDTRKKPGPGRKASGVPPRAPWRPLLGPHPGRQQLSPADGLLDWPLLQVDEVVQGRGALVIIRLCEKHPVQRRALPLPQPSAPAPGPRSVFRVAVCPPPPHPVQPSTSPAHTNRAGQVIAHSLLLHQLQPDVNVKLATVLNILVAAQGMLAGGTGGQGR